MQDHRYSKSQAENVAFLKRIRKLLDQFPNTTTVGEVGDSHRAVQLMAEYTSGGDKLHMCYSFEFLDEYFTAEHFRSRIKKFFSAGADSWPCWSFSNHDVKRHISRWAKHAADAAAFGRQTAMLLLTLKGSVCIYQGEELGLPEADILFEELTDPPGIRFWPEYKGRDGCRTPLPWEAGEAPNGFTGGKPWLPVKQTHSVLSVESQQADPGSLLNFYRSSLAFRKQHPALVDGDIKFFKVDEPVLAFRRLAKEGNIVCVFNLSPDTVRLTVSGAASGPEALSQSQGAELGRKRLTLAGNGYALFHEAPGSGRLGIEFNRRAPSKGRLEEAAAGDRVG
jgi:alpha-glucosidase